MTVTTDPSREISVTDGVATSFPFDFQILAESDLVAVHYPSAGTPDTLTLSSDYTINAGPWPTGGTVTTIGTPLSAGELVLYSSLDITQPTDLENNRRYNASVYEKALDRLTLIAKQLNDTLDRTVKADVNDDGTTSYTMPSAQANYIVGWNAAGTALENKVNATSLNSYLGAVNMLVLAANKLVYATGSGAAAATDLTAFARSLLDDSSASVAKVTMEVITSLTGSLRVVAGTEAQRDGTPQAGYFRFNTDTGKFEGYDGTTWGQIGGGGNPTQSIHFSRVFK